MKNIERAMVYLSGTGRTTLTAAQARRVTKHRNRALGENGPGKVTPAQIPSRPNNPRRKGKRRG